MGQGQDQAGGQMKLQLKMGEETKCDSGRLSNGGQGWAEGQKEVNQHVC